MLILLAIALSPLVAVVIILRAKVRGTSQPHKLVQPGATPGPVTNSFPDSENKTAHVSPVVKEGGCETPRRPGRVSSGLFNFRDAVVSNIVWLALIVCILALIIWNELTEP